MAAGRPAPQFPYPRGAGDPHVHLFKDLPELVKTASANGSALVADSTKPGGVKWAAPTPAAHTHIESDVTSLVTDLAGKAPTVHTHAESDVTNLPTDLAHAAPSGLLSMFAGSAAPAGWLLCDGTAVSRTTYAALFAAIGTTYGVGDGSTTFNVPNLKGRMPVGLDAGNVAFDALALTGGEQTHVLTAAEMPVHNHSINIQWVANTTASGTSIRVTDVGNTTGGTGTSANPITANAGSGSAHENMPPFVVVNYIIKT